MPSKHVSGPFTKLVKYFGEDDVNVAAPSYLLGLEAKGFLATGSGCTSKPARTISFNC